MGTGKLGSFILIAVFSLNVIALAFDEEDESVQTKREITRLEAYKIGYADGYEKGKKEGFLEGYKKAIEDFRKIYKQKLQEYREIEAGKILIQKWRVSYPRVYQVPTPDGSKIIVEGCKIVKPVDDLLSYIPFRDSFPPSSYEIPVDIRKPVNFVKARVKKSFEYALREYKDVIYFRKQGSNWLEVYFTSEDQKREFCLTYKGACR